MDGRNFLSMIHMAKMAKVKIMHFHILLGLSCARGVTISMRGGTITPSGSPSGLQFLLLLAGTVTTVANCDGGKIATSSTCILLECSNLRLGVCEGSS